MVPPAQPHQVRELRRPAVRPVFHVVRVAAPGLAAREPAAPVARFRRPPKRRRHRPRPAPHVEHRAVRPVSDHHQRRTPAAATSPRRRAARRHPPARLGRSGPPAVGMPPVRLPRPCRRIRMQPPRHWQQFLPSPARWSRGPPLVSGSACRPIGIGAVAASRRLRGDANGVRIGRTASVRQRRRPAPAVVAGARRRRGLQRLRLDVQHHLIAVARRPRSSPPASALSATSPSASARRCPVLVSAPSSGDTSARSRSAAASSACRTTAPTSGVSRPRMTTIPSSSTQVCSSRPLVPLPVGIRLGLPVHPLPGPGEPLDLGGRGAAGAVEQPGLVGRRGHPGSTRAPSSRRAARAAWPRLGVSPK